MTSRTLPLELKPALDNGIPAEIVSCSKAGIPNATTISKVYWIDESRVALSFQFFNKTIKNVRENPRVAVELTDPAGMCMWHLDLEYHHSETTGPVFEEMDMAIEAIASMTGMTGIFKLRAADIYDVRGWAKIPIAG